MARRGIRVLRGGVVGYYKTTRKPIETPESARVMLGNQSVRENPYLRDQLTRQAGYAAVR
jgi:hypothetical protein